MRRTILYYPNIVIPDGAWLRKSLLYWDEVSSIVPIGWEYENRHNDYWLQYLEAEGEYRPIHPHNLMNHDIFHEFESEIISKYRTYQRWNKWSIKQGRSLRIRSTNDNKSEYFAIHRDKMTP
ncbi:MAG: hypothetical protein K0R47_4073, partial [Brevibacillus sp.]|nr:hypothetical protein [Brevibacillus sp.]